MSTSSAYVYILFYFIIIIDLSLQLQRLIIPLFRRTVMCYQPRNAIKTSTCSAGFYFKLLLCLIIPAVYMLYLSSLIAIYTCLHLRCLVSSRYANSFNRMIILFLLTLRMLIYTFLLLSIITAFWFLFDRINLSVKGLTIWVSYSAKGFHIPY